jgi:ribose transport system permease protein
MKKELGIFILLVVLCTVVSILNPRFLAGANLQNMARLIGAYGVFSIGIGIVIITGGIDLSVGSVFALLGALLSMMLTEWGWVAAMAVIVVVGIAMGLGFLHGLLITRLSLQPFIVTLCGLLFYRGLARFIAKDETKGFGSAAGFEGLRDLATGSVVGIPTPFVLLVVISIVMWVVLHRSVYGRYLFAVGRNEEAARYSGINSRRIITVAYIISGLMRRLAQTGVAIIIGQQRYGRSPWRKRSRGCDARRSYRRNPRTQRVQRRSNYEACRRTKHQLAEVCSSAFRGSEFKLQLA